MRCKNDFLMRKIGVNKLDNYMEVDFNVLSALPDCRRINASQYVNVSTDADAEYNRYKIPANQFECMAEGCANSGTLLLATNKTVTYFTNYESIDFANGVLTFYIFGGGNQTMDVTLSAPNDIINADTYTIHLGKIPTAPDGFKAVVIDLSKAPSTTAGTGWTPSRSGTMIRIQNLGSEGGVWGISSLAIYDSMEDFEINSVVKIGCLTSIDGSWDLDAVEQTCLTGGGYNAEEISNPEKTITGKLLTPNFYLLNPFYGKGKATKGFDIVTIEKDVAASTTEEDPQSTVNPSAGDYGVITVADMAQDECGFVKVARSLGDDCIVTDAELERLAIPSLKDMDIENYVVVPNEDGSTSIYFNKAQIGATMVISYPQVVEVDEYVFDVDNINTRRVRMSYVKTLTDKTKWRFIYDNVLITSFPDGVSNEETELEFTIQIQKDSNGRYGRALKINGIGRNTVPGGDTPPSY